MEQKRKGSATKRRMFSIVGLMIMLVASVQVSYALNAGSPTPVPAAEVIPSGSLAPSNFLQVVDGMPSTDVEILEMGSGVKQTVSLGNITPVVSGSLFRGDWSMASTQRIPEFADYEALSIQFNGSDPTASNYATDTDAGWNTQDLSLDTTNLWLKVKYTNAGYYKGEMIDAVATIKVTPYKNRTVGASWASIDYSDKVYYPMIQLSELLYNGWSWQNIGEFNVDLTFYKKGESSPIEFPTSSYYDTSGVYYTLNSLNPAKTFIETSGSNVVTTLTGPEYVWPKSGTVSHAYIATNSNIQLDYNGDSDGGVQYGYNGGTNQWGGPWNPDQDKPTSPDWNMNSVMFTTANTSNINFTLGLMERDPFDSNHVKRTSYMWASFSTDSFASNTITYIDIPVSKVWTDQGTNHPDRVTVELYQEWTTGDWADTDNIQSEKVQTVVLDDSNNWSSTFKYLPSVADLAEKLGVEVDQVRYAAKEIEVPGYTATYTYQDDGSIVVSNKEVKPVAAAGVDIEKKVMGNPATDETFTFELTPDEETFPMPPESDGTSLVTIDGPGSASFGTWTYTKPGTYTYQVKEVAGSNSHYTYDKTVYTIVDTVSLNDAGDLEVSRVVLNDDKEIVDGSISFTNQFTPKPVTSAGLEIKKTVAGQPKTDETFTFELTPDDDTFPMPVGSDRNKKATITGQGTASFGTWTYTMVGVYTYQVKEVEGTNPDYIYDSTVYTITDAVTMNVSGDLEVTRTIETANAENFEGALPFNNQYKPLEEFPNNEEPTTPDEEFPTTPESNTPVRTGDTSQTSLFFLLATMSLTVLTLLVYTSNRQANKQH